MNNGLKRTLPKVNTANVNYVEQISHFDIHIIVSYMRDKT